ncbi:zinc finger CCCH domain-containing protein 19-like [Impatiens glandulifera]|uniref:zinc finger CCCH domain-containing protein 19-like n=1 Tax=Impatiens glandulifera TaxID=253017 RepID=UPI001FB04E9E|nr:zinc finger CCCH domain-containing protein 19-like [Impatiens glandulifera]
MQQFPIVGVAVSIMELQLFSFFILTRWHSCFNCNKPSKYHCFFCPSAVCQHCSNILEFARVRDTKGFCHNCLKLALLGEANKTEDSDEEFVDFSNRDTFECLFLEYWLIIKEEEKLTSGDLQSTDIFLKNWNKRITSESESESKSSESDTMSNSSTEDVIEIEKPKQVKKRSKVESSTSKTRIGQTKTEVCCLGIGSSHTIP